MVAFDSINCMVALCFNDNLVGRKGEIKMLNTIIQGLFVWLLALFCFVASVFIVMLVHIIRNN